MSLGAIMIYVKQESTKPVGLGGAKKKVDDIYN